MNRIEIGQTVKGRREILTVKVNENALLERQAFDAESEMLTAVEKMKLVQQALGFLERLANTRRGAMKGKIEEVITEALRMIYGPKYKIDMTYSVKNNRSSLEVEVVHQTVDGDVRRGIEGFGGGVADTISVPMRLMVVVGSNQTDRVCFLDECYRHVDPERIELVGRFIYTLCEELGFQVFLCSHHEPLRLEADRAFRVSSVDGVSRVETF